MKIRKAFLMKLRPGQREEYHRRHNPIWPELQLVLKSHGVHNYSIFYDPLTDSLFGYVEIESETEWESIASEDVCRRWWSHMAELMETNPDDSPVSIPLAEMFHID